MKALWNSFKAKLTQTSRKTVILGVIAALLFLLPTSIAIRYMIKENESKDEFSFSVTVFDQHRTQIASVAASENPAIGNNMADVLYRIITKSTSISRPPFSPEDGTPIYVSAVHNGITTEYTCYFSVSGDGSYYIKNGEFFAISDEAALNFISFPEAESLYRIAEPPQLFTNTEELILPISTSWYYKLGNNTYQQAKAIQIADDSARVYSFVSSLDFRFADEPDVCYASVISLDTGRLAFEGLYGDLSQFTVDENTPLQVHLRAVWNEHETGLCHGEISYSFIASLRDCAAFSLTQDTLAPSDFVVLTCHNIFSPGSLILQAPDSMSYRLFTNDSTTYCVIPYPAEHSADTLDFTVTYGASTKQFSISLLDAAEAMPYVIEAPTNDMLSLLTSSSQSKLHDLLRSNRFPLTQTVYFRGNMLSLEEYGFSHGYTFNDQLFLAENLSLPSYGTEYLAPHGTSVPALISGEVIATGYSEALGNYVILHHGLGIQTWYAHLSDFDVRTGDIVALGQSVGKTGVGGVYSDSGVLLLCTVNGSLCDPESLIK